MNEVYTIDLRNKVLRRYVSESAAQRMGNGQAIFRNAEELLDNPNVNTNLLVEVYNENTNVPVKRFSDNKTGAKRILKLCSDLHLTKTYWDSGEYNSKLGSKKTPSVDEILTKELESVDLVKTKKVSKPRGAFAGKKIKCLIDTNPRKEGTRGWNNFSLFLGHGTISYEEFVELAAGHGSTKGGCREDLAHDIKKGRVELIDA